MTPTLKQPEAYHKQLIWLRERNPYAAQWVMRIERKTNRHPESAGGLWGWYEIWPLNIEVGFWGSNRDDLEGVDIAAWNKEAEQVSKHQGELRL
jgi:hypothetical protein